MSLVIKHGYKQLALSWAYCRLGCVLSHVLACHPLQEHCQEKCQNCEEIAQRGEEVCSRETKTESPPDLWLQNNRGEEAKSLGGKW